ncbi:MAG: ECF RNA polymerase sigma factor SigK [Streptosporangiaceae bacterium]
MGLRSRRDAKAAHEVGQPSMEQLVDRVSRGDEEAFAAVYQQVAGPVYGLVRRVVRDPARSEEVTQEVLVEVWRAASRFNASRGSALSWVMTMAHHRAVDHVRATRAAADRDERDAQLGRSPAFDEVAEEVESGLDRERVRHGLAALTELQREALVLAYYGGYTYQEVADLLDIPLGTAKTRLRDGLIHLRDHLGVMS